MLTETMLRARMEQEIILLRSEVASLKLKNKELREAVGRMQGLLNLQEKIGEVKDGKS